MKQYTNSLAYALSLDRADPLKEYRSQFLLPKRNGSDVIYFCGNSLGLQPRKAMNQIGKELEKWSAFGVEGHFKTEDPWINYHQQLKKDMGTVVGAHAGEIAIMNTLTVNIHLLMVSFYEPTKERYKIICEKGAFPSDLYVLASQARFRGFDPADVIVELSPRPGEQTLNDEDILNAIEEHADQLALIWIGGVNYYTGQVFDMKAITSAGHLAGAIVGFDLAHAAGNVELDLHEWEVDFACWCTYKYLNSGPGGIGAVFIHKRHGERRDLQRFEGWWGNELSSRFQMRTQFAPAQGADGWALSTSPILLMAPLKVSLEIFTTAGMKHIFSKRDLLTGFLKFVLLQVAEEFREYHISVLTPESGGAQLSIVIGKNGREIFEALSEHGVVGDWREPAVIRLSPAPLYNTFEEVFLFGQVLRKVLQQQMLRLNPAA